MSTAALPIGPAPRPVVRRFTARRLTAGRPAARQHALQSRAEGASGARRNAGSHTVAHRRAVLVRRAALLAIIIGMGLVAALLIRPAAAASDATPPAHTHTRTIVVGDGQSLWSIAADAAGDDDPRDVIVEISEMNGLSGSVVHPGQRLEVPAR